MPLTLRAVSLNDVPLTQPISARFDIAGGTIGRADNNTMALPDPERHISRQQAQISDSGGGFSIRNVGAANPILVRNQRLLQGESAPLAHRDQVRIGGYLLEVFAERDESVDITQVARAPADRTATADVAPRVASTPRSAPAIGTFDTPLSGNNPFADLLGASVPRPAAPTPRPADRTGPPSSRLPDDFDPFALPAAPAPPPAQEKSRPAGVFADLIPEASPTSLDDLFGLQRTDARDPLAGFAREALPSAPSVAGASPKTPPPSTDPLAMFDLPESRPRSPSRADTVPDHVPELNAAFRVPRPLPPSTGTATATVPASPAVDAQPRAAPSAASSATPEAALWAAFCDGARVDAGRVPPVDADAMRTIGSLLRTAIDGTMRLVAVRSATRHELHAQVTVIQPRNNNPLKFSPDAESALEQMLAPPIRGFLAAPEAMNDAMGDLVGHAIGTMAGMRAALEGVLVRFTPAELERKLVTKSLIDSVLPIARKAKLWELYLQHYESIRDEAQEDFHALFGKAFLAAYEQQLERLRRDEASPSG